MKTCHAGHDPVLFGCNRCPVCFNIERLDKENLKLAIRLEELQTHLDVLKKQVVNLKEEVIALKSRIDPLNWNGGAT